MRTGGGIVSLGLLASAAIAVAAPQPAPDVQLSAGGVLEADKPLTIGVRGDRGSVFVQATVLPDEVIARLYRDGKARRVGGVSLAAVEQIGVPAQATLAHLDRESGGSFVAAVDLRPLLGGKRGLALVEARRGSRSVRELYQVTDLGVLVLRSPIRSIVQVLRLSTGAAVAGATIMLLDPKGRFVPRGATDGAGMLIMNATASDESLPPDPVLLARAADGSDQVVVIRSDDPSTDRSDARDVEANALPPRTLDLVRGEQIEAALFTDRDAFQRGDTLQAVGWIAAASAVHPDGMRLLPAGSRLRLTLAQGATTLAAVAVTVTPQGRLWGTLPVPANAPTGNAQVSLALPLARGRQRTLDSHTVRIESVSTAKPGIALRRDRSELVRPDEMRLTMVDPTGQMSPTGTIWHEMTCEPIWRFRPAGVPDGWLVGDPAQKPTRVSGAVNPRPEDVRAGMIPFVISSAHAPPAATSWCRVRVRSPDRSGRDRTAEAVFLVHPGATYVALHAAEQNRDRRGASVRVGIRAVSTAGTPVAPRGVTLELDEDDDTLVRDSKRPVDLSSGRATVDVALPAPSAKGRAGYWVIVRDGGGQLLSRTSVDEPSGDEHPVALHAPGTVAPGETVSIVVDERADTRRAGGLVAILGGGVQRALPLPAGVGRAIAGTVVGESFYPRVDLEAAVLYPRRDDPAHLAWLRSSISVPEATRALEIAILTIPDVNALKPARAGQPFVVRAVVRRVDGAPVPGTRATIAVVAEAVLARGHYPSLASDIGFLRRRNDDSVHWDMFGDIVPPYRVTDGWPLTGLSASASGGSNCGSPEPAFGAPGPRWIEPTAAFFPDLAADAGGAVTATISAPTRGGLYRIRVVASAPLPAGAPGLFGSADAWLDIR